MDHSYDTPQPTDIYIGAAFSSLADFQFALSQYMHETCTVYNIAKSQRLQNLPSQTSANKGYKKKWKPLPPELKYQHAMYGCKHYGALRSTGRGIRPNQKSFKTGCPSHITLCVDRLRGALVVKSAVFEHNHRLGPEVARLYPENRVVKGVCGEKKLMRVTPKDKTLLSGAVVPSVHHFGGDVTWCFKDGQDRVITQCVPQDGEDTSDLLTNPTVRERARTLPQRCDSPDDSARFVDLEDFVVLLTEDYDCRVDVYRKNGEFHGLFFQDRTMTRCYSTFPEHLCFDCSFALLFSQACVYLMSVEDSLGKGEIVGVGILSSDDGEAVDWLLSTFERHTDDSPRTRVVLSNGFESHVNALKKHFPESRQLINPSHCLKVWKQDIPHGEAGITEDGKDFAHSLLLRALLATSLSAYNQVFSEMKAALPPEVASYYCKNWHEIKDQWVLGLTYIPEFMASASKIVELMKRKLSLKTNSITNIPKFLQRIFFELQVQRMDRNKVSASLIYKMPVPKYSAHEDLVHYSKVLTPHAVLFLTKQLELIDSCKPLDYMSSPVGSGGSIVVPVDSCCCPFYVAISLPCCHIFVRRRFLGMSLFDANLCAERWTKEFYLHKNSERVVEEEAAAKESSNIRKKVRRCDEVATELAALLVDAGGQILEQRLELLEMLMEHWSQGEEVALFDHMSNEAEPEEAFAETRSLNVEPSGVYELLGMNVNRYTEVAESGETQETDDTGVIVGDEVEVVILQSDIAEDEDSPRKRIKCLEEDQ